MKLYYTGMVTWPVDTYNWCSGFEGHTMMIFDDRVFYDWRPWFSEFDV